MATVRFLTITLAVLLTGNLAASDAAGHQSRFRSSEPQAENTRFRGLDRNSDGIITRDEWRGSDEAFRRNDWNNDGILSGDELRPGATAPTGNRRAYHGIPFAQLDSNDDDRITPNEWNEDYAAFQRADRNGDGVLTRREYAASLGAVGTSGQSDDCLESPARVVDDIYQQVLERPADDASAEFTQALSSGRMTVRDIVARVAKSEEHKEHFFWQPVVSSVYQQILRREPTAQELREAASALASGRMRMPEIVARTATRAANNEEDAVRILYRRLLGRDPDPSGLQGFTALAEREGIEAVARQIVSSPEYRQRAGNGLPSQDAAAFQGAVRSLYRHLLGRDPDQGGLKALTDLAVAYDVDAVVDRIVSSPEYSRLYGSDVVPGRNVRFCGPTR